MKQTAKLSYKVNMGGFAKKWSEAILAGKQDVNAYNLVYAYEKEVSERHKKKNGVFYTPTYIVDYIVSNTLSREKIQNKAKILDPACGSGAFLLGAFNYILDSYKFQNLTIEAKKELLKTHVFGIDIDQEAVNVTKLVLLLKVLESEDTPENVIKQELINFAPDSFLENNILVGNALIDFEYLDNNFDIVIGNPPYVRHDLFPHLKTYLKKYEVYHGNADLYSFFIERGLKLLKPNGIYSVIVANKWLKTDYGEPLRKFLLEKQIIEIIDFGDLPVFPKVAAYPCILTIKNTDNYVDEATKQQEYTQIQQEVNTTIEKIITNYALPTHIKDTLQTENNESDVIYSFQQKLYTLQSYKSILNGLFISLHDAIKKAQAMAANDSNAHTIHTCLVKTLHFNNLGDYVKNNGFYFKQDKLDSHSWAITNDAEANLLEKIKNTGVTLSEYIKDNVYRGVVTGANEAFVIDEATKNDLIHADVRNAAIIKPYLTGKDIKPYETAHTSQYLIFTKRGIDIAQYPEIEKYLSKFKSKLEPKPKNHVGEWEGKKEGTYKWYEIQDSTDYYEEFEKPKIMYQVFQVKPCFILDTNGLFCNNSVWIIPLDDKYLLALLNSKLGWYLIAHHCSQIQNGYQLIWKYLSKIPIKVPDLSNKVEEKLYHHIVKNVQELFKLYEILKNETVKTKVDSIKNKITYLEDEINEYILDLYNITHQTDRELILQY